MKQSKREFTLFNTLKQTLMTRTRRKSKSRTSSPKTRNLRARERVSQELGESPQKILPPHQRTLHENFRPFPPPFSTLFSSFCVVLYCLRAVWLYGWIGCNKNRGNRTETDHKPCPPRTPSSVGYNRSIDERNHYKIPSVRENLSFMLLFVLIFLIRWVELVDIAVGHPNPSVARTDAIMTFCRSFVPADVTEDDVTHFSGNLASDEEYFVSMQRELRQVRLPTHLYILTLKPYISLSLTSSSLTSILTFSNPLSTYSQCMSGVGVESISGNQKTKAMFILQAPEGAGKIIIVWLGYLTGSWLIWLRYCVTGAFGCLIDIV